MDGAEVLLDHHLARGLAERRRGAGPADLCDGWVLPGDAEFGYPDEQITTVIDGTAELAAKVGALDAYRTQVIVGPTARACALSNNLALPIVGYEHYALVAGELGPPRRRRAGDPPAGRGWSSGANSRPTWSSPSVIAQPRR